MDIKFTDKEMVEICEIARISLGDETFVSKLEIESDFTRDDCAKLEKRLKGFLDYIFSEFADIEE